MKIIIRPIFNISLAKSMERNIHTWACELC
jgi:hypothetical protein